jgi:serine/threonine protein kinase
MDRYLASRGEKLDGSMLGHMAPEFASRSSAITDKCDVYGFGIILLELVTGRRPVEYANNDGHDLIILCDFVRASLEAASEPGDAAADCIDPRIAPRCREQDALSLLKLGLMCTSHVPSSRPSMAEVVRILEFVRDRVATETSTATML